MARIPINIADHVGRTPMVQLTRVLPEGCDVELFAKLEAFNPGGSVKDRIGVAMIEAAEAEGRIEPGRTTIVEATSGNTGIALAFCCAAKGYELAIFLPQGMSRERETLLRLYGAQVEMVESLGGHGGGRRGRPRAGAAATTPTCPTSSPTRPTPRRTAARPARRSSTRSTATSTCSSRGWGPAGRSPAWARCSSSATRARRSSPSSRRAPPCSPAAPRGRAPHPGHRRGLRPGRAQPRRCSTRSWPAPTRTRSSTARVLARARGDAGRDVLRRGGVGRPGGRPPAGVARQADRRDPARLGRALHLARRSSRRSASA